MKKNNPYRFFSLIIIMISSSFFLFSCEHVKKKTGLENGQLTPCPNSPNCVGSMESREDEIHYAAPIKMTETLSKSRDIIKTILNDLPRVNIIVDEDVYLHAKFTTKVMRFVDDVEFYFDEKGGFIHYRSASRIGHSDLGVNRKRMQEIKDRYQSASLVENKESSMSNKSNK